MHAEKVLTPGRYPMSHRPQMGSRNSSLQSTFAENAMKNTLNLTETAILSVLKGMETRRQTDR